MVDKLFLRVKVGMIPIFLAKSKQYQQIAHAQQYVSTESPPTHH